jgi:hypothetical protein
MATEEAPTDTILELPHQGGVWLRPVVAAPTPGRGERPAPRRLEALIGSAGEVEARAV